MNPVISVMIVTYNQEEYIAKSIESILEQECSFPYEIVIGEDCSTDRTRAICESYASMYPDIIRLIKNEYNKGLLKNYVDTLLSCRGDFIADLAGDDYWIDKNKLQRQTELLLSNNEIVLVHSRWKNFYQSKNMFSEAGQLRAGGKDSGESIIKGLFTQKDMPYVFMCTCIFRKDSFMKIYEEYPVFFNPEWKCEDFQILTLLSKEGAFYYEDKVTTVYRILTDSVSNTNDRSKQFEFNKSVLVLMVMLVNCLHIKDVEVLKNLNERANKLIISSIRTSEYSTIQHVMTLFKKYNLSNNSLYSFLLFMLQFRILYSLVSSCFDLARDTKKMLNI